MTRGLRQPASVVIVTALPLSCDSVSTSVCQPLRAPLSVSFKHMINTSRPLSEAHPELWDSGVPGQAALEPP